MATPESRKRTPRAPKNGGVIAAREQAERALKIDEFGGLEMEISLGSLRHQTEFAARKARKAELQKEIASWAAKMKGSEALLADGAEYSVHISPQAMKRSIDDMKALFAELGEEKFFANCSFTLEALDRLISPGRKPQFITFLRSGPRTVVAIPRVAPQ